MLTFDSLVRSRRMHPPPLHHYPSPPDLPLPGPPPAPDLGWVDALVRDAQPTLVFTLLEPSRLNYVPAPLPSGLGGALGVRAAPSCRLSVAGGRRALLPTGLRVDVPSGFMLTLVPLQPPAGFEVFPDCLLPGAPREVRVPVRNRTKDRLHVRPGQLIAQLVVVRLEPEVAVRWQAAPPPLPDSVERDATRVSELLEDWFAT